LLADFRLRCWKGHSVADDSAFIAKEGTAQRREDGPAAAEMLRPAPKRASKDCHQATFYEEPREEEYGIVVVFEDIYGNCWDLYQNK